MIILQSLLLKTEHVMFEGKLYRSNFSFGKLKRGLQKNELKSWRQSDDPTRFLMECFFMRLLRVPLRVTNRGCYSLLCTESKVQMHNFMKLFEDHVFFLDS